MRTQIHLELPPFGESARERFLPTNLEGQRTMSKDRNTYAKRQRETEQKRKAEEKRARRQQKKDQPDRPPEVESEEPSTTDAP